MAGVPPENNTGLNLFLSWGVVEWLLTAMGAAGMGVAGWVWSLGLRVKELESKNEALKNTILQLEGDTREMKQLMQSLGRDVDRKINEETQRLEHRLDRMSEKLDQVRDELPSRQFIEGQINNLSQRIDRSIDLKIAGRGGG